MMRRLAELKAESRTLVFYESIHRLGDALDDLQDVFGFEQTGVNPEGGVTSSLRMMVRSLSNLVSIRSRSFNRCCRCNQVGSISIL